MRIPQFGGFGLTYISKTQKPKEDENLAAVRELAEGIEMDCFLQNPDEPPFKVKQLASTGEVFIYAETEKERDLFNDAYRKRYNDPKAEPNWQETRSITDMLHRYFKDFITRKMKDLGVDLQEVKDELDAIPDWLGGFDV